MRFLLIFLFSASFCHCAFLRKTNETNREPTNIGDMYIDYAEKLLNKLKSSRPEARGIITDDFAVSENYNRIALGPDQTLDYVRELIMLSRNRDGADPQVIRVCYGKTRGNGKINRQELEIDIDLNIELEQRSKTTLLAALNIGNLYVGSNVRQREQLGENYLEGTKVVAINGSKNIRLVSRILEDQGAKIQEFDFKLHQIQDIQKAISTADVLIDGVQMGGSIEESQSQNGNLIVAQCDCDDPFSAMTAVARISMALFERQKNNYQAQRLIASDSLNYWKYLNRMNIRRN